MHQFLLKGFFYAFTWVYKQQKTNVSSLLNVNFTHFSEKSFIFTRSNNKQPGHYRNLIIVLRHKRTPDNGFLLWRMTRHERNGYGR